MKIEVDTKHDSKEELSALADMLQRLSRSSGSGAVISDSKPRNIFDDDPAPSGGLFGMFGGDSSPSSEPALSLSVPAQNEPASGGLFSLFSDDSPSQSSQLPQASEPLPGLTPYGGASPSISELLSGQSDDDSEDKSDTSVKDILDDDNIVPY